MVKYKRVNGKTYRRVPGAPALWYCENSRLGARKRYNTMELESLRKKKRGKR